MGATSESSWSGGIFAAGCSGAALRRREGCPAPRSRPIRGRGARRRTAPGAGERRGGRGEAVARRSREPPFPVAQYRLWRAGFRASPWRYPMARKSTPKAPEAVPNAEQARLDDARANGTPWRKWGPYLSERQWGTVREDYSEGGDAWNYFTHDQARSRAYRWGEDGLAGISDERQHAVLRARALERQGPHPQGAALRPHQQRGQPRRGREGVLLLPRQHADPLVHEVPVQVPAGRLPLRRPRRRRTAAGPGRRWSTSCSTPGSSTTIGTSTSSWSTPRPDPTTSSCRSPR